MSAALEPLEMLENLRRGDPIDPSSVDAFVRSWSDGAIGDPQMAAWCMGVCIRGLDMACTEALTRAMILSLIHISEPTRPY